MLLGPFSYVAHTCGRLDLAVPCKVVRDITPRKRREERLEETVIARTKDLQATIVDLESFSYSMSHDLRAPLRAIISFSQFVPRQTGGHS